MPKQPNTPIWTGNDVTVYIYSADPVTGDKLSEIPIFSHCFMQDCTVAGSVDVQRRPVTGRPRRKIVTQQYDNVELSVGHFYLSKAIEINLDDVFHREKVLLIEMECLVIGDNPDNSDLHTLRMARATDFSISSSDNRNVTGSAKFSAEEFL